MLSEPFPTRETHAIVRPDIASRRRRIEVQRRPSARCHPWTELEAGRGQRR